MPESPWMALAWADLGLRERPGKAVNPRITAYFRDVRHSEVMDDETAWCAAFVGSVLERAGLTSTRSLMARSYLEWGEPVAAAEPGVVAVLSRGSDPALGHVGFVVAATSDRVILLGGNQSDSVSVEAYDRDRIIGLRVPKAGTIAARGTAADGDREFAEALPLILAHEGGWSDDPFDPGGATNKGITLAVYAREIGREITVDTLGELKSELRRIPDDLVRRIYLTRYWRPGRCAELPAALALFHFDACVNQGVAGAARFLQRALDVDADGEIGPVTLAAAARANPEVVLEAYADIRRRHYRSLGHFWRFGRGWLTRTDKTLAAALKIARRSSTAPSSPRFPPTQQETSRMPSDITNVELPTSPTRGTAASEPDNTDPATKWWGQSLTIWGAMLTAVTTVAPAIFASLGIDMPADLVRRLGADTVTAVQALAGLAGTIMTIAGRIRARGALETRRLTVRL